MATKTIIKYKAVGADSTSTLSVVDNAGSMELHINGVAVATSSQGGITALTDNSGGTAADTIAAIGATYDQGEVRNAIASLAAKINELVA